MRTISIILCLLALAGCVCSKSRNAEVKDVDRDEIAHTVEELSGSPWHRDQSA